MCGIVGYSGPNDALPFMMKGLSILEYRGYDSAGVGVLNSKQGNRLEVRKEAGVLKNLEDSLRVGPLYGNIGIGHTRWATHGKPTQVNAHPHISQGGSIAVVHNGIIENHVTLRTKLQEHGFKLKSQTDTEVIPNLIQYYESTGLSIEKAFLKTLADLEGAFAMVMISSKTPNHIYATRRGSPLIAGVKEKELFLGSDCYPLGNYTDQLLYLDEDDIIVHKRGENLKLLDSELNPKEVKLVKVDQIYIPQGIGDYESFTEKEIHEQPDVLDAILDKRLVKKNDHYDIFFEELSNLDKGFFNQFDRIYITGCGTAYHAAYIGKYYIEEFVDIPVEAILSSEFRYSKPKLNSRNLVITISQSGETADTLASIIEAKKHGSKVLSIVNVFYSSIARESDMVLYTHAGPEIGVASTKAFTSQVLTLLLWAIYFGKVRDSFDDKKNKPLLKEIEKIAQKVKWVLSKEPGIRDCALKYHLAQSALYLGRHLNFPIALEGALKNKEVSYMHAEGYAAGEMKHGPIALIDKTLPVICVCTQSATYEKMVSNIKEVEAREGIIITVATEGDTLVQRFSREVIYVPPTSEELSPILNAVALQLLAYYFAKHKGLEIDKPRNLAKSVTVE